jgi:ABC-type polar amino acid transport system ATPase subunit
MLAGQKLRKTFGSLVALNDVDVSVARDKITVVIGPSGSGKTTLLRALALLDPPDRGCVSIDGTAFQFPRRNSGTLAPPWPKVTVVFQQLFLWPHLTLRENILLPLRLNGGDFARFEEVIRLFGMIDFLDRYPNEASLGQRQRAALARALVLEPHYVLLDEITSALDIEQTGIIMNYLFSLRDRGIGLMVVTHFIGFAKRILARREGDQLVFLEGGSVLESGDIGVLENPKHPRLRAFLAASQLVS